MSARVHLIHAFVAAVRAAHECTSAARVHTMHTRTAGGALLTRRARPVSVRTRSRVLENARGH